MKTPNDLQEAVERFRQGNQESFDKIYELSYKYLHTCVIHIVKDEDTAMDMLQETYMEVSRSIHQLKNTEDFLSWAAMIANRKCFACLKKDKDLLVYENSTDEDEEGSIFDSLADDDAIIPEEILQDREKQCLIREIIDNLSDMQRLCVIGYYYNEQKQEEIAKELGIPLNTVKTNLSRAKANIREAVIDMDVKKGTRLYSFAPFMLLFFSAEAEACELKPKNFDITETDDTQKVQEEQNGTDASKRALKIKVIIGLAVIGGIITAVTIPGMLGGQNAAAIQEQTAEETQYAVSEAEEMADTAESRTAEETQAADTVDSVTGYVISEKYQEYGIANQGLIPVCNNQGKYGLVTYDDRIIVPLEYNAGCKMVNGDGQSFFEKDGVYTVFDRDGKELFHTERTVRSVNEGIIFVTDGMDYNSSYAYYRFDGSLVYDSGNDEYEKAAVGFNEGYAFMGEGEVMRLSKDGTEEDLADIIYPENSIDWQQDNGAAEPGGLVADVRYRSFVTGFPLCAAKGGYFLMRGDPIVSDLYGVYTLRSIDGPAAYEWDISNIFNKEGLKFSASDASWDFAGFYEDGNVYCNNGTYMCAYINVDGKNVYYLVDVSKMTSQEYVPQGEYGSDEDYWDFDRTVLTEDALIARADYISLSSEDYWLIQQDGKWGYIDHAGNVMGMYDDAACFHDGKAVVIEDKIAYAIDESFQKIKEIGPAEGVTNYGELYAIRNTGELFGQMISLD